MSFNPYNNGQYNVTSPTLGDGSTSIVQLDVNGNQKVAVQGIVAVNVANGAVPAAGSTGATLKQSPTTNNLAVESYVGATAIDPRTIRALTSADQVTVANASLAVTVASLPLPTGAASAAKQPALGTAGTPSADVITVQGAASMTALKVDGSAVTQPVSNINTVTTGTTAPSKIGIVGGKTSDATPQYQPIPLTNAGAAVKVDGSATTQPVSVAGTVGTNMAQFGGTAVTVGAHTSANCIPVVIASDQATVKTSVSPTTSGGCSTYSGSVGATLTAVKGSAGQMYGAVIGNSGSSAAYVQIFDAATVGAVTLGTTAPKLSFFIPAGGGLTRDFSNGVVFSSGIIFACTTTRAGSTAPTNTVDVNYDYA